MVGALAGRGLEIDGAVWICRDFDAEDCDALFVVFEVIFDGGSDIGGGNMGIVGAESFADLALQVGAICIDGPANDDIGVV